MHVQVPALGEFDGSSSGCGLQTEVAGRPALGPGWVLCLLVLPYPEHNARDYDATLIEFSVFFFTSNLGLFAFEKH